MICDAVIGLGSNIGDKPANIALAIRLLNECGDVQVARLSSNYRTAPWGNTDQDWFVNACAVLETKLGPHALLARCQEIERKMGRIRSIRWGPRIIDLDILMHRFGPVATADLTVPHPGLSERAFVLVPLAEIAPDMRIAGRRIADLLSEVDTRGVCLLA